MSSSNDSVISFRIADINTHEYALIEENYNSVQDNDSSLISSIEFGADPDKRILGIRLKFIFEQDSKPFLIISTIVGFVIEEASWESLFTEKGDEIIIPLNFATHMGLIGTGTVRGILHEKTANSGINAIILPPIDLTNHISEDVRVNLMDT